MINKNIKVASASVIGTSHLKGKNPKPCQDNNAIKGEENQGVVVVSDGAGSKSHSHIGSKIIVKSLKSYLLKNFDNLYSNDFVKVREKIMDYLIEELDKKAKKININFKELSSTMLFVVIKDGKYIYGHVGDGMIACLKGNEIIVASKPENGEYANQTFFIHPQLKSKLRMGKGILGEIRGFIVMSDGGEAGLYNRAENKAIEANKDLILWLDKYNANKVSKELKKLIIDKFRKITNDDCTIAMMYLANKNNLLYGKKGTKTISKLNNIRRKGLKIRIK